MFYSPIVESKQLVEAFFPPNIYQYTCTRPSQIFGIIRQNLANLHELSSIVYTCFTVIEVCHVMMLTVGLFQDGVTHVGNETSTSHPEIGNFRIIVLIDRSIGHC